MKLLQLDLAAFGHFTDVHLDFPPERGFNLIYGANEAGKSTTRRALLNLLFGIPERTQDAFLHSNENLRIGAQLHSDNDAVLQCYRRKGRKNTLLDPNNTPLDETALQPYLNSITAAQFQALFCFDHEQLRQGGEDLLNNNGDVGESLFGIGSGTTRLHELLTELDKEAATLFKARASKPRLNQILKEYRELSKKLKDQSLSANRWQEQAQALDAAKEQHATLSQQLHTHHSDKNRLARIQRTFPLLQRRDDLQHQLNQLRDTILLPDDASTQRWQHSHTLNSTEKQIEQIEQNLIQLNQQIEYIHIPETLLEHKVRIDNLREQLGSHLKAARDLPGVRTEFRTTESEAQTALRRLYPELALSQAADRAPSTAQREKIKQLADEYPALREKQFSVNDRLDKLLQNFAQQQALFDALPTPPDTTALQAAVTRALKQGDLEATLAQADKTMRQLNTQAEIDLKQLGLWHKGLDALEQAHLVSMERVEHFMQRFQELDNDRQRIKERIIDARHRNTQATQKLDALRWAGEVPTEEDLKQARQVRQQHWHSLKHTQPDAELYRAFETALTQADDLADRLRREAQRVAEQATLLAERSSTQQELDQQSKKWHQANELLNQLQTEWEAEWQALDIKPGTPQEMRHWLANSEKLRQQVRLLREKRQQLEGLQQQIATLCHDISQALAQLPEGLIPLTRLHDLIEQAQTSIAEANDLHQRRTELQRQIKNLSVEQQRLQTNQQQAHDALEHWRSAWGHALTPLQLPDDTHPDTARTILDTLDQVLNKLDKMDSLQRRITSMERDANAFRDEVQTLLRQLATDLCEKDIEQAIPQLINRLSQTEQNVTRREQLQKNQQAEQQQLQQLQAQHQAAQGHLQTLLQQAHCSTLDALEIAENASKRKKNLQQQLATTEQQLLEHGEGLSLATLQTECAAVDVDQLPLQLRQHSEAIAPLEAERSGLDQKIGELRLLLKQMDGNDAAAQAADEAQLALAEIQELSERYMQVHLAASVLRKSIERYREQHQAPLLNRTSTLFQRITLGRFKKVKAGFNGSDSAVLLGCREDDNQGITTTQMSDGSRDQLYLALRLASIEQYFDQHTPLPLLVDDILINFDDARAAACMSILGELSQKTQVLFFTHHPHLVKIAEQHIKQSMAIHYLN